MLGKDPNSACNERFSPPLTEKKTDFGFENAELGFFPANDVCVTSGVHSRPSKTNQRLLRLIVPTPEQKSLLVEEGAVSMRWEMRNVPLSS